MTLFRTCILLCTVAAFGGAQEPFSRWNWFRASTVINNWNVDQGRADVIIKGRSFNATLWDSGDTAFAKLSLEGSINRNSIRVTVTVNETDAPQSQATGRLERRCWKEGGGREVIILAEGLAVIGLVRELPPDAHCASGA